jgi:hypothetical protein
MVSQKLVAATSTKMPLRPRKKRKNVERSRTPSPADQLEDPDLVVPFDGLKLDFARDESPGSYSDQDDSESESEFLGDEAFGEALAQMAVDDNPKDDEWIPLRLRKEKKGV